MASSCRSFSRSRCLFSRWRTEPSRILSSAALTLCVCGFESSLLWWPIGATFSEKVGGHRFSRLLSTRRDKVVIARLFRGVCGSQSNGLTRTLCCGVSKLIIVRERTLCITFTGRQREERYNNMSAFEHYNNIKHLERVVPFFRIAYDTVITPTP